MKRSDRLALNALSKDLYGTSSKWQKMLKGIKSNGLDSLNSTPIQVMVYFNEQEVVDLMIEERLEKNDDK